MKRSQTRVIYSILICLTILIHTGCATMFAPSNDNITIKTIPSGAEVYLGANNIGKTPLTYTFDRDTFEQRTLTIRLQGYKTQELLLQKSLEKSALFNFVFFITTCGATSWGIDALSGNMIKYYPDSYLIDLVKEGATSGRTDQLRLHRLRFVVLNKDNLQKDIAMGDGEFLKAFFVGKQPEFTPRDYQMFLSRIILQSQALLVLADPVVFFNRLEEI